MSEEPDFGERLSALCAAELTHARRDHERAGAMVERLAAALGMSVAVLARGNPKVIDEMLAGADGYAHAEAVEKAPFARFMADISNHGVRP